MSVPNTTTFTLQDVVNEVNPTTDDLVDCFADAISGEFDSAYEGSKDNLLNFRNYASVLLLANDASDIGFSKVVNVTMTFSAGETLGVFILGSGSTMGTATVTDDSGGVWTELGTIVGNVRIFYTTTMPSSGSVIITGTLGTSDIVIGVSMVFSGSQSILDATIQSNTTGGVTTVSKAYTPRDNKSIIISTGLAYGTQNSNEWQSYGTGQSIIRLRNIAGDIDVSMHVTKEETGGTSSDTQSFTNNIIPESKTIRVFDILP